MKINISGKHMELGEAFQTHVENRLEEGISKYIDRINLLEVVATKEGHRVRVDIHANTGTNSHVALNSSAEAGDVYSAFDAASDKVEKQLRRYKRKLTNHHRDYQEPEVALPSVAAKHYVLDTHRDKDELEADTAPAIIAEKPTNVETLTVSEAVMRMDLGNLPALMFYNAAHGRINFIYRRDDGNVAWVDPEALSVKAA